MDDGWREHRDPRVAVLVIVPFEEAAKERSRIFERAETFRKVFMVLNRLEVRLRVRIIVADLGTAQRTDHAKCVEEIADELRVND
jgi:hypothetical protein